MTDRGHHTTLPKIEDIPIGVAMAITIAPCDKHQYNDTGNRLEAWSRWVKHTVLPLFTPFSCVEWFTELSPKGRLHLHGTIVFPNLGAIKEYAINHIAGIVDKFQIVIKPIDKMDVWMGYCTKQCRLDLPNFKSNDLRHNVEFIEPDQPKLTKKEQKVQQKERTERWLQGI